MEQGAPDRSNDREPTLSSLVAGRIRALRLRAGLSARQLVELCADVGSTSLTRSTLAKIESGVRESLTIDEVGTLAEALNVSIADLVAKEPPRVISESAGDIGERNRGQGGTDIRAAPAGRVSQRHLLAGMLTQAQASQPNVVVIEGQAGIGKTHLIEWLADRARSQRALVLQGSCLDLNGMATPYGALSEGLRLFDRQHATTNSDVRNSVPWSMLSSLISGSADPPATSLQLRVFQSVLELADALGRRYSMLLLIFEDIHWADPSTLDLIHYIARVKSDQRLLLVCTHRPVPQNHPLRIFLSKPDLRRRIEFLSLPPLNLADLDDLVRTQTGRSLPEKRLQRYLELSEGNAYYAGQLVATDDLRTSDVEVPRSLRDLMITRLTQLSEASIDVVRIAAVAGRQTDDNLLAAVSNLTETQLDVALTECIDGQILIRDGDDKYVFQHSLLRDTAYFEMRSITRKRIHARIAEIMAASPGAQTRLAPELAHHWFEGGRLQEALTSSIRAAEMSVRMYAFREATAHYERALGLWADVPDAALLSGKSLDQVLSGAADAARSAGDVTQAEQWIRRALSDVDAKTDPMRAGELHERLGSYLWEVGKLAGAAEAYETADHLIADLPASAVASRVQSGLAAVAIRQGHYSAGGNHARRAVDLARSASARTEEGLALSSLGLALTFHGRIDEARTALHAAIAIAKEVGHLEDLVRAYGILGVCLEQGGRLEEAVTAMTEGLEYAKDHNLLHARQSDVLAGNAAAALLLLGRYAEGAAHLDPVLRSRSVAESMYGRLTRAQIYVAQGRYADAERLLSELRGNSSADPRFVGPFYGCMAEAAAWSGDLDRADSIATEGMHAIAETASPRVVVELAAIALRIAADRLDAGRANKLIEVVKRVVPAPDETEVGWLTRQCQSERDRASGDDSPDGWAAIADGWASLTRPFMTAYAHLREAHSAARTRSRMRGVSAARKAGDIAERIGAEPLAVEVRTFLERLPTDNAYGLTRAEMAILTELATGATNAVIAERRAIAVNTVGIHVGHILRKMAVSNRRAAVETALREGVI